MGVTISRNRRTKNLLVTPDRSAPSRIAEAESMGHVARLLGLIFSKHQSLRLAMDFGMPRYFSNA